MVGRLRCRGARGRAPPVTSPRRVRMCQPRRVYRLMEEMHMFRRVVAAAACVLLLAGCQAAGPGLSPTASITAPSSVSMKSVDVPFTGVVDGDAVFDFQTNPKGCASTFTTITTAKGQASHMGLTTWRSEHCLGAESQILDSELVLTAANGDKLFGTYSGSCAGTGVIGEPVKCSGSAVFSGGTGRFEKATASGTWTAAIIFQGFDDLSWPGRWEWKGTIRY